MFNDTNDTPHPLPGGRGHLVALHHTDKQV
jgi:hypothetical protein